MSLSNFTYLLINLGSVLVPLIFSFHPKINFFKRWSFFFPANLFVSAVFITWDIYFTQIGVWGFNNEYILGFRLFGIPLEEILFFICIPYSSVFTYHCIKSIYKAADSKSYDTFSSCLIAFLFLLTVLNYTRAYTSVTFFSLAITIFIFGFVKRTRWLGSFYIMYLLILFPFFIVNGILTGTGLEKPVVWYNNAENLGFRIMTIPVEDIFYGMLMLLLNTGLYEKLRQRDEQRKNIGFSI